jgi:hypothetical protein
MSFFLSQEGGNNSRYSFFWAIWQGGLVVCLPTLRDKLSIPSLMLNQSKKVGKKNYQYALRKIPAERKTNLLRGGSMKSSSVTRGWGTLLHSFSSP